MLLLDGWTGVGGRMMIAGRVFVSITAVPQDRNLAASWRWAVGGGQPTVTVQTGYRQPAEK